MVSIIGTTGRRENGSKLTGEVFLRAIIKTKEVIRDDFKLLSKQIHLVSGGVPGWVCVNEI